VVEKVDDDQDETNKDERGDGRFVVSGLLPRFLPGTGSGIEASSITSPKATKSQGTSRYSRVVIAKAPFGTTGHESTRTIFGGAALGSLSQAEVDPTLAVLLEHGVNHIDTAASYGDSELRLAPWLARNPGPWVQKLGRMSDLADLQRDRIHAPHRAERCSRA
jgi:Aldo/keto reductase family